MKLYNVFIFMLLLILSVGAVCAQDLNDTAELTSQDTDSHSTDNSLSVPNTDQSFDDLDKHIDESGSTIEINNNYTFDSQKDEKYINGFTFRNSSIVINGNFNIIDGSNKASVFKFINSNVIINNLIIKNSNAAIMCGNSNLTTNNVTFINNTAKSTGAAVYLEDTKYESYNDKFINNYAVYGSAIFAYDSAVICDNGQFRCDNPISWGLIYGEGDSLLDIKNSSFINTTSKYATAIYASCPTSIRNSKFINLFANRTAGAIAFKNSQSLFIGNCEFLNVSSVKNGGAVFADTKEGVVIVSSNFTDCRSEFGGAVLQLRGYLSIVSSNFIGNAADYSGGAIYSSNSIVVINSTNFTNNRADLFNVGFSGGAIFADNGALYAMGCRFDANDASSGDGIYLYDIFYEISDSQFKDNGEAIFAVFADEDSFQDNNKFNGDTISLDNKIYSTNVFFQGKQIILNPVPVIASVNDTSFDLRNWNLVTPVKNQGSMGSCWAFGAAGAFESAFLKATNITLDLSENNIQNNGLKYSIYGEATLTEGGFDVSAPGHFVSWLGPITGMYDDYDELGKISPIIFDEDTYHVFDTIYLDSSDRMAVKEALINYGAMSLFISGEISKAPYYNKNTSSVYINNPLVNVTHFVNLIGWDDSYSASNFYITPPGDGAWICKNSWGTEWGNEGFFYISYYDLPLNKGSAVGFIFNNTENYNKLYQYDVGPVMNFYNKKAYAYLNNYVSGGDDLIAAVGTYFENGNADYRIKIYVEDIEVYSQSGKSSRSGYETIKLNQYVPIKDNQKFTVRIEADSIPVLDNTRLHFEEGVSEGYINGKWYDLTKEGEVASIKVYTLPKYESQINVSAINIHFAENVSIIATVNENATGEVIFSIGNQNYTISIADGKAILNSVLPNLNVGTYNVTAFYMGDAYYEGSTSSPVSFNVSKTNSTLDIISKNKMLYVLVGENATGNVTVIVDGKDVFTPEILDNRVVIDLHNYSDGKHDVKVTYGGDDNYFNNSNSSSVNLKEIHSGISIVLVNGLEITAVLKDSEGNPVSNVFVSYNVGQSNKTYAVTNDNGEFTIKAADNSLISMIFEGNENITGCDANITLKNIRPDLKATKIVVPSTMKFTAVDYKAGEKGSMFYFYLKDADGKALTNKGIKIGIFDKIYTVKTDKNGRGGLQINIANANYYTYAITFLGDDDYKASFAVCSLQIVKKSVTITPVKTSYSFKASAKTKTVTATLKSTNSYIPKGKQVTLTIAGKTFKATIGAKGQISFNIGSITKKGTYNVAIKYAGSNTYSAATSKNIKIVIK